MPWPLIRLSLRARLYLVCAVLIALLLTPSYYTLRQLAELRDIAFDLQSRHAVALLEVGRIETSLSELNRLQRDWVSTPSEEARSEMFLTLDVARRGLVRLASLEYHVRADLSQTVVDSLTRLTEALDSLVQERRMSEASAMHLASRPVYERGQEALASLGQAIDAESMTAAVRAQSISERTARTAAAATGLAAGLAVLLALLSVGAITNPLRKLRSAMAAVAGGRFAPPSDLPYGRPDEIGDLTRSFRAMTERLAELDRLKAEFVSIASHELKTPVNVVRGYVDMIEEGSYGGVDEGLAEALRYIREQTEVLRERVDQLLAMSRLEAQGMEVKLAPVALGDLFEEVRRNFAGLAAQKRIVFRVRTDPSLPDMALLDRRRVRDELIGNLLGNAFKFTPAGGGIDVHARGEPGWLIFQIRDTGEGIPPAQLPYIFEKYYQAGRHAGKVGAGLGLAIAREIVDAHGGRITVESREGKGSVFRVELPLSQVERAEGPAPVVRVGEAAVQAGGRSVLPFSRLPRGGPGNRKGNGKGNGRG